jgi:hypothetical protein
MGGYYHTEHARVTVEGGWLGLQDVPGLDWKCRRVHITSKPSKHHDLIRLNNTPTHRTTEQPGNLSKYHCLDTRGPTHVTSAFELPVSSSATNSFTLHFT